MKIPTFIFKHSKTTAPVLTRPASRNRWGAFCALLATALCGTTMIATAQENAIHYPSGGFTSTDLSLNGSSLITTDGALQLTQNLHYITAGDAWFSTPVSVQSFTTNFTFQILTNTTDTPGDGFTFTIQNNSATTTGNTGGELGYGGIPNSVAVKFDTYNNGGEGTDSTGIYINGAYPDTPFIDLTSSGIVLTSGDLMNANLAYDGSNLTLVLTDTVTKATVTEVFPIDIPATIAGNTAFVGFTGGTGVATTTQNILSWTYASPEVITSPKPGSTLTKNSATFEWTKGSTVTDYQLTLGTQGAGSNDLGVYETTANSYTVGKLPTNGSTLYARLSSKLNGVWGYSDFTYTAVDIPVAPTVTSPASGTTLSGSTVTFNWTEGHDITGYQLRIGTTTVGSGNLLKTPTLTDLSYTATNLPTNASTVYFRLFYLVNGGWLYKDYTYTSASTAALTTPTPGSTLSSSATNFTWTKGGGVTAYKLILGSTVGGSDLYDSYSTTANTKTANNLPANGATIYARLYSEISKTWLYKDYTYTAAPTGVPAVLTTPANGSTLAGSSATFTWSAGSNVSAFKLILGSTAGASDLYNSYSITATSVTVKNLPIDSRTIYATLYSKIYGVVQSNSYTFTAAHTPGTTSKDPANSSAGTAVLTTPTPGSTLSSNSATFTWTTVSGATAYKLILGSTAGGSDLYDSYTTTANTKTVWSLPTNGATIYARLYSEIGKAWLYKDYTYTAAPAGVPATLTTPAPGSTLTGSSATFTWSAGSNVSAFKLILGSTPGASDLFDSYSITSTSVGVIHLPMDSRTIYATLYSKSYGVVQSKSYTYTAATKPVAPVVISPAPGTTLSGSTVTFDWTQGSDISGYQLRIGTTVVGSGNLLKTPTMTDLSYTATNLPTDGSTVYFRLFYLVNGGWLYNDYTYTAYTK